MLFFLILYSFPLSSPSSVCMISQIQAISLASTSRPQQTVELGLGTKFLVHVPIFRAFDIPSLFVVVFFFLKKKHDFCSCVSSETFQEVFWAWHKSVESLI